MAVTFWHEHPAALAELILDALEGNDFELLRGIQCFSEATRWTHLQGLEGFVNTIFMKTIGGLKEAKEFEKNLVDNELHYIQLGTYDTMRKRLDRMKEGKIQFSELKMTCIDLSQSRFMANLNMLESSGFIETDRKQGEWDMCQVWLPKRHWDGIIEDSLTKGQEESVYSSALATMIAHASQNKTVKTLKVIYTTLRTHGNDPVSIQYLRNKYNEFGIPVRKLNNFIKRDSQKIDQIKAITNFDGKELLFNREMIRFNTLWEERTRDRFRRRGI